jgi:3-oxoadipate enol-lactonase
MPHVTVRDIDICFDRVGAGPPLLAISGSGGDLRLKPNLLETPLVKAFDVLAYDQRGLGRTSKPNKSYSMADYAEDAAALLDAIGWQRVRVFGISFGGMVALELVLRHPDRVSKLALCSTSQGGEGGSSYPHHILQNLSAHERARVMVSISDTRCDSSWAVDNPGELDKLIRKFSDDQFAEEPGHRIGISRLLEARRQHDTWERIAHVGCPVLACGGLYDGIALPSSQKRMVGRIPGATLLMFEGGHQFLWQDSSAFPEIVRFLAA